jgi:probable HAF family extracellular repeat protein
VTRLLTVLLGLAVCAALAAAPAQAREGYPYTLVDLGALGGPQSAVGNIPIPFAASRGTFVGTADTATADPYGSNENPLFSGDPFVQHTFAWRDGTITDLGALGPQRAMNSSWVASVNGRGALAGVSDNGTIDPVTGYEEADAVLWKDGQIINLGTLGGHESVALWINNRDEVVGAAANTVADSASIWGWATQSRAFVWRHGTMHDLGTLGGPDASAFFINDRGQIAGNSYTNSTPNPVTGSPTTDAFLWDHGNMHDLGTLGGTLTTVGGINALNNHGDVVGQSNLAGDLTFHPFLWDGSRMLDLGTLGGDLGSPNAVNDRGQVVGWADTPLDLTPPLGEPGHQLYQAFLWSHGVMRSLGTAPGDRCSTAYGINDSGTVVGNAGVCHGATDAFISDDGSTMNLNTLIAPSTLHLKEALSINDRGEIMGIGVLPDGSQHEYVLVPNAESDMVSSTRSAAAHAYPSAVAYAGKRSARARYHTHLRAGWVAGNR